METRTFQAREIKEALALVRRELGPDAVILGTRKVPGRALGLLGGSFVEVTAAGPEFAHAQGSTQAQATAPAPSAPKAAAPQRPLRGLIRARPKRSVSAATGKGRAGVARFARLRRTLLGAMVPQEICERWLSQLAHRAPGRGHPAELSALRTLLAEIIGDPVPLCWPGTRVATLLGPTGVGKTTTLAKLAAQAALVDRKRVGLVTMDDQRVGSTAQLRAYARALQLPMVSTHSAGGLDRALASLRDVDLVLVDTPGMSPGDRSGLRDLAGALSRAGEPMTRHLCLAAFTRQQELDRILQRHALVQPDAVILTKVDETIALGTVFTALVDHDLSFSFATTGQRIPDDLCVATATFVIDELLGGTPT